jgi:O-antigen/teichoic acid export membrane protein
MKQGRQRAIAANTLYTIGGALVINGVLQLLIYPRINRDLGTESYGTILYIMAFINILGPSVGQALNNSRLVLRREFSVSNGDYNILLLLLSAAGTVCTLLMAGSSAGGWGGSILISLLIFLTVFRYYGDVEFRLTLRYRDYFFYYTLCGAGYAIGYAIFRAGGPWYIIFLAGEALALLYVFLTGSVFRKFLVRSRDFSRVMKRGPVLVLSYLITNLTLNIDRLVLKAALGSTAVSQYYVYSLIGKTLVLFVAPVNTILISYLTRDKKKVNRTVFLKLAGAGIAMSGVFFVLCEIGTPLFIRIFYPGLMTLDFGVMTAVNLTQILAILSAYLFIIVLTFTDEKWQLGLQGVHLVLILVLVFFMTDKGGFSGFCLAVLIANLIRTLAVTCLGFMKAKEG